MRVGLYRTRMRAADILRLRWGFPWRLCGAVVAASLAAAGAAAQTPAALPGAGELRTEPSYLDLSAGAWDLVGNAHRNRTAAAGAEFRFGRKLFHIGPAAGVLADLYGGGMVYAGLYGDIPLGPIVVTPLAGFGAWWRGGSRDEDLGSGFEFRVSLEAAYQLANRARLGLRFGHISNADTSRTNPGENDLMLTYALPLDF